MNRLYNEETETLNELGRTVDDRVSLLIKPIVETAVKDGIALRDLHEVISSVVDLEVCAALLHRNAKFYLKRKERDS